MELSGVVQNGQVVLDDGNVLPEGTRVTVVIAEPASLNLQQRLLRHAGTVPDLPSDLAEQHDHYLHGTPKK